MLVDEVTNMEDYGYFIDIDNGAIVSKCIMDTREYKFQEKDKYLYDDKKTINYKSGNTSLFCLNTLCCVAVSILFIKTWIYSSKN
jgi:Zn/Cd-binding protein ZinT